MLTYIIRRLLLMFPTLLGVVAVVFFVMAFSPGGFGLRVEGDGGQNQGYDAKRVQRQMERRYGADLSKPAQFVRWLNQVSPVGFAMSSDVTFEAATKDEVQERLSDLPLAQRSRELEQAADWVLGVSAYKQLPPMDVASDLAVSLQNPGDNVADWLDTIDAGLDEEDAQRIVDDVRGKQAEGLLEGQRAMLKHLVFEFAGRSTIRWDQPTFKVPDLGESTKGRNVSTLLAERLPVTLLLNVISVPIIYVIAVLAGMYAAKHKKSWFDVGSGLLFTALWSAPVIWIGVVMLQTLGSEAFMGGWNLPITGLHDLQADRMPFLPSWGADGFVTGYLLDACLHLVMPVICLSYAGFAVLSRVMRGSMIEAYAADFVRTARAKGVSEKHVLWRHVFPNSILPLITMAAAIIPGMIVGSVVVEQIFSIDGMGKLAVEAAFSKDKEVVLATTLMAAILKLSCELLRDVCYALADPRVSYE